MCFLWIGQISEFVTPEIYGNFLDSFTNESKDDSSGHVFGINLCRKCKQATLCVNFIKMLVKQTHMVQLT